MRDIWINDFSHTAFRQAFRAYFAEIGVAIKNWESLFEEMNNDRYGINWAYLRLDDTGRVIGFIQCIPVEMKSWFFSENVGFVREFWVDKPYRKQGHGAALLQLAESYFAKQGILQMLLTSDTAGRFYQHQGYEIRTDIRAVNNMPVYMKPLTRSCRD